MLATFPTQAPEFPMTSGEVDPLVQACRAGDTGAWEALYETHFDFAWRTARRLGVPQADVEDAVQDAFRIAWERLAQFTYGRFTTWLYRIVANVVSERLRRARVRDFFGGLLGRGEDASPSVEAHVEARSSLRLVEQALRKLSHEKREVFALFEIEGLSHQEIAELTGVKIETVRTRLHYARRDFERLAEELGVSP